MFLFINTIANICTFKIVSKRYNLFNIKNIFVKCYYVFYNKIYTKKFCYLVTDKQRTFKTTGKNLVCMGVGEHYKMIDEKFRSSYRNGKNLNFPLLCFSLVSPQTTTKWSKSGTKIYFSYIINRAIWPVRLPDVREIWDWSGILHSVPKTIRLDLTTLLPTTVCIVYLKN